MIIIIYLLISMFFVPGAVESGNAVEYHAHVTSRAMSLTLDSVARHRSSLVEFFS